MATVSDVCTAALQRLAIYAPGEAIPAADLTTALTRLNVLKDSWRTQRLFTYALVRSTWNIVANTSTYTVGTGSTVNIQRPVFVEAGRVRLLDTTVTPVTELPLTMLTDAAYAAWPQKTLTSSWPSHYHYNPTSPLGTLTLLPVPTASTLQGAIYTPNTSTALALSDVLDVPPGYELFYQEQLAVHLAPDFDRVASEDLKESARDARADLKRANIRLADVTVVTPFTQAGGWYDIQSDHLR